MSEDTIARPDAIPASDLHLEGEVIAALKCNRQVPFDRVQVSVRDGAVTLRGYVHWKYERAAAATSAAAVPGVNFVDNKIVVDIG